jgi:hypothetical protein
LACSVFSREAKAGNNARSDSRGTTSSSRGGFAVREDRFLEPPHPLQGVTEVGQRRGGRRVVVLSIARSVRGVRLLRCLPRSLLMGERHGADWFVRWAAALADRSGADGLICARPAARWVRRSAAQTRR